MLGRQQSGPSAVNSAICRQDGSLTMVYLRSLAWLAKPIPDRSQRCIIVGRHTSEFRPIKTGVPPGAVLSPHHLNILLYDFPSLPRSITLLLYAYDITVYTSV